MYFAWTIQPPLTAAFLGAGYFSSFLLEFLASRETEWCKGRIAVPAVFIFTTLTLVATLLHVDRFHFNSPGFFAFSGLVLVGHLRYCSPSDAADQCRTNAMKGVDSARSTTLGLPIHFALGAQSIVMLGLGVGLFVAANPVAKFWPWMLTPLTSQAVGAWLIGTGVFALHSVWENDTKRIRSGMLSYTALAVLQLIALARYSSYVDWAKSSGWLYLLFTISILLVGIYSLAVNR